MTKEEYIEDFNSKQRYFEMFTKTGNKKCQAITTRLIRKILGKKKITLEDIQELAGKLLAKAYLNPKTSEILDSEPPYHIKRHVDKALKFAGYDFGYFDIEDKVWKYVKELRSQNE